MVYYTNTQLPPLFPLILVLTLISKTVNSLGKWPSCYFLDGSLSPDDIPCAPHDQKTSHCCNWGDLCLTNGLCYDQSQDGGISRGSCTDASFPDPECAGNLCRHFNRAGGVGVTACPDGGYCCAGDPDCDCNDMRAASPYQWAHLYLPLRESQYGHYLHKVAELYEKNGSTIVGGSIPHAQPVKPSVSTAVSIPAKATKTQGEHSGLNGDKGTASASSPSNKDSRKSAQTGGNCPIVSSPAGDKGSMIGLGLGLGIPFLFTLMACAVLFLLNRRLKKDINRLREHEKRQLSNSQLSGDSSSKLLNPAYLENSPHDTEVGNTSNGDVSAVTMGKYATSPSATTVTNNNNGSKKSTQMSRVQGYYAQEKSLPHPPQEHPSERSNSPLHPGYLHQHPTSAESTTLSQYSGHPDMATVQILNPGNRVVRGRAELMDEHEEKWKESPHELESPQDVVPELDSAYGTKRMREKVDNLGR